MRSKRALPLMFGGAAANQTEQASLLLQMQMQLQLLHTCILVVVVCSSSALSAARNAARMHAARPASSSTRPLFSSRLVTNPRATKRKMGETPFCLFLLLYSSQLVSKMQIPLLRSEVAANQPFPVSWANHPKARWPHLQHATYSIYIDTCS